LVGFGLGPQLKTNFEQIFSAPFLVELLLAELAADPAHDSFFRLHFDGSYRMQSGGVLIAVSDPEAEGAAQKWLNESVKTKTSRADVADVLLQAWWWQSENKSFTDPMPDEAGRQAGWREAVKGKVVEAGWLARQSRRPARYQTLTIAELGL
jgi:hypothetical protein